MTIGRYGHSAFGTQQHQHLEHDFKEHIPTGELNDINSNNIHMPFSRNDVRFTDLRYKPTVREIAGFDHHHDYKKQELTQVNPSVAVFNDLYNYNPTQGVSYFDPHETDKLIHHPTDKPRFELENYKNLDIQKEIQADKKVAQSYVVPPKDSFVLKRQYRT